MSSLLSTLRSKRAPPPSTDPRRGAPRDVLWRMLGKPALDIGVGSIPMLLVVTGVVGLLVVSWRKFHVRINERSGRFATLVIQ